MCNPSLNATLTSRTTALIFRHPAFCAAPKTATLESASYEEALYARAQAALRVAIGEKPIEEVLQSRSELSARLQTEVAPAASALVLSVTPPDADKKSGGSEPAA